jgi:hypothetical protein
MDDLPPDETVVHVVAAAKNGRTEFWAVIGTPAEALTKVRRFLPLGYLVALTGRCLDPRTAAALSVCASGARKLRWAP